MKKLSATYIFQGDRPPIKGGVVVLEGDGTVVEVLDPNLEEVNWEDVERHEGVICPGFINSHCHLELSYLKDKITEGTQLHGFVKEIITKRAAFTDELRDEAIRLAEQEMIQNGIVAVGDISNGDATFLIKKNSAIRYHTFVEVFGSDPKVAATVFQHSENLYHQYFDKKRVSITPHATYSVSDDLTKLINQHCSGHHSLVSIHNQETKSENDFFKKGKGELFNFLDILRKTNDQYQPTGENALPSFLGKYKSLNKVLLVHNTFTEKEDIDWANNYSENVYWCFCPNANLYIENTTPNFELFANELCTIGTDSLASNWSLSILDELKVISDKAPSIALEKLIQWATHNGAQFFNFNDLGTIEKGKKPGINLITNIHELKLTPASEVKKLL